MDPSIPYAWQPVGETIEVPVAKSKRLNVLGFLNTDNDLTPFCVEGSVTSDIVIGCFDLFSETITKKTVVIIDNAPIHTSQAFQKRVPIWKKKGLVLYFLPGYAPRTQPHRNLVAFYQVLVVALFSLPKFPCFG